MLDSQPLLVPQRPPRRAVACGGDPGHRGSEVLVDDHGVVAVAELNGGVRKHGRGWTRAEPCDHDVCVHCSDVLDAFTESEIDPSLVVPGSDPLPKIWWQRSG